jgi:5-hydroxyisourate hydrolase-like protein (transthyretin family)
MIALLLAAALTMQGAGGLQPGTGIVSGVLKTTDGRPASGVRVGAVDAEDPASTSLLSVTETDANGKYRLTNIPAGRYYIVAGRLNNLHYYPSGGDRAKAAEVEVGAARIRADVNFVVPSGSQRLGAAPPTRVAAPANSAETLAYQKITAEKDLSRKAQLVTQFEKDFPKSLRLPEEYISLSRSYASQQTQMEKALQYAERAAVLARGFKNAPPAPNYDPAEWQQWAASIDANAQSNLAWVKQMDAWQNKALFSLVAPRRQK